MMYKKKANEIFYAFVLGLEDFPLWFMQKVLDENEDRIITIGASKNEFYLNIETNTRQIMALQGDYVVYNLQSKELYILSQDEFNKSYEKK